VRVEVGGENPLTLACDAFVNCAGLSATQLSRAITAGLPPPPTPFYAKGNYYALQGCPSPFKRLVYPVPEAGAAGLGVHATINLGGQTRFGPDVEWLSNAAVKNVTDSSFPETLYVDLTFSISEPQSKPPTRTR
jgi:L-2-hydroxyglutarate oxidase LhgO